MSYDVTCYVLWCLWDNSSDVSYDATKLRLMLIQLMLYDATKICQLICLLICLRMFMVMSADMSADMSDDVIGCYHDMSDDMSCDMS